MADERVDVLVVDADPRASEMERLALASAGARCWLVDDSEGAKKTYAETKIDAVVIGPSIPTRQARQIVERIIGREAIAPRVVRLSARDPSAARLGRAVTDALVFVPAPDSAIVAAVGVDTIAVPSMPPRTTDLVRVTSVAGSLEDSMRAATASIRKAFDVDVCVILTAVPNGSWVSGSDRDFDEGVLLEIHDRALASARGDTVVLATSVVTEGDEFESCVGVRIIGDDNVRTGMIALFNSGFRTFTPEEIGLLRSLGQRMAVELSWRGVHSHVLAELDSMRDAGGLDPLLGVWTEPTLVRLLEMLVAGAHRSGSPLSAAVIDVRGLGEINERFGHAAGDAVLKHIAELAVYAVRSYDVVARRHGGIAVVFNATNMADATKVVERVRHMFGSEDYVIDKDLTIRVDTRAGIAGLRDQDTAEQLLLRAARAAGAARDQDDGLFAQTLAPADSEPPPETQGMRGLTLGGMYRILHEIGHGGGGGVYRGVDLGLSRPVAIKVLNPDLSRNAKALDRFRDEAAILASIRHQNLVQIYAFGVDAGYAYFAMELVEGESVEAAITRHRREDLRLPFARVSAIVKQAALALDTLHRSGVVHRDVKPANILIDPFRSRAVLVDVGIAARRSGSEGYVAGTPPYMAPEVFSNPDPGPSADVFGLAATIYEMLTLERPWPHVEDLAEHLDMKRTVPPIPPSQHRPELALLDHVFARGLHPDPDLRYPNVLDLAGEMRRVFAEIQEETTNPESDVVASTPSRRISAYEWSVVRNANEQNTRAVVFRSIARVLGARVLAEWRVELARQDPALADALSPAKPPLGWLPTRLLGALLDAAPGDRDAEQLGLELGRATVRATFRRFFPAAPATLSPRSTVAALEQIWAHYHSWGVLEVVMKSNESATLTITDTPKSAAVCSWVRGMLQQVIIMSGGEEPQQMKLACEAKGGECCRYELSWQFDPG
jgi:uncharacterized protein (TIGR02265 family)